MIQYREAIIKRIVQSPDTLSVGTVIDNSLEKLVENGTHPFIILRFIEKLKTSLSEIKKAEIRQTGWNNILQALNVLNDYDVKKITGAKTKNK